MGLSNGCNCDCGWDSYNFQIRSLDQIDFEAVESELSHKNQMMLLRVDGIEGAMVFLHDSVYNKSSVSGKEIKRKVQGPWHSDMKKLQLKLLETLAQQDDYGFLCDKDIEKVTKLVRRIRKARWDVPLRAEVTVSKVEV